MLTCLMHGAIKYTLIVFGKVTACIKEYVRLTHLWISTHVNDLFVHPANDYTNRPMRDSSKVVTFTNTPYGSYVEAPPKSRL